MEGEPSGSVRVPSSYDFIGKVILERKFEITPEQLDSLEFYLVVYGANYSAEVWINGDFIANHVGGYTSFVRSIPRGVLRIGSENVIAVTVSNELSAERTIPFRPGAWGWRNYGGLIRDVFLLGVPKFSLRRVLVRSRLSTSMTSV
ncbi:MAG: beta galactosidase jelly roll domain-containing protein, partial [Ignavibacteria bacterium]|nr:beta galactosidase jelly roll domain-containing protein [Ignavibacteria bacterium]